MTYEPKPVQEATAETHNIYADLQLILDGTEWMGCADSAALIPLVPYDEGKDIALWKQKDLPLLPMRKGNWALFLPGEPHAPSLKMQEGTVKKAVFKIRYGIQDPLRWIKHIKKIKEEKPCIVLIAANPYPTELNFVINAELH